MTSPIGYVPQPGDHVYVGPATPAKVHWIIHSFLTPTLARLESPMSGRTQYAPVHRLTLHTPAPAAQAPAPARASAAPTTHSPAKRGRPGKNQENS